MTNSSNIFVSQLDLRVAETLKKGLIDQGFELTAPTYTLFSGKKKGVVCTLYQSGKLVVQGREKDSFIEFYLEPNILKSFNFTNYELSVDLTAHIGIDESGKGDFFGPLCIAGVYAEGKAISQLKDLGVRDSKLITDASIHKIADKIKSSYAHHIVKINPAKYNELYQQFANLNKLLAWGHATTIENLVLATKCSNVIIDQFAAEHVVITALKRKKLDVALSQRHRGEEDLVVAAASILARHAFLDGLQKLGSELNLILPKGASAQTIAVGKRIVEKYGKETLGRVAKLHFKTLDAILVNTSE